MSQDFTLEDILEEQRQQREAAQGAPSLQSPGEEASEEVSAELPSYQEVQPEQAPAGEPPAYTELSPEPSPEIGPDPEPEEGKGKKKKKKKGWSLFGRRKKVPDFDENEDDMYYGIQLKPIDEYRMDGDKPPLGEEGYKALFDDTMTIDVQVEENFLRLQKERRRRVAEAVQSAGLDEQQVAEEFGVVAPMPVTSFAADPYARQHGLDVEGVPGANNLTDIQRAMLETGNDQTMEIKLNVLNSTIELQSLQDGQPVSEETVERILEAAPPAEEYVEQYASEQYAPEQSGEYVEQNAPETYIPEQYAPEEYVEQYPSEQYAQEQYAPEQPGEYTEQNVPETYIPEQYASEGYVEQYASEQYAPEEYTEQSGEYMEQYVPEQYAPVEGERPVYDEAAAYGEAPIQYEEAYVYEEAPGAYEDGLVYQELSPEGTVADEYASAYTEQYAEPYTEEYTEQAASQQYVPQQDSQSAYGEYEEYAPGYVEGEAPEYGEPAAYVEAEPVPVNPVPAAPAAQINPAPASNEPQPVQVKPVPQPMPRPGQQAQPIQVQPVAQAVSQVDAQPTRVISRAELEQAQNLPEEPQAAPEPPPRPVQEIPYVESIYEYRSRNIPTHMVQADVLQSALLSEVESLQKARDVAEAAQIPRRRVKRKPEERLEEPLLTEEEKKEAIEDYTGQEDARSISNELRGEMHELSMRMMITGVCAVLLALTSLICRSQLGPKDGSSLWSMAYVIMTLVFTVVAVGVSHKTVGSGLKGLFVASANADSGVAIAAAAVLVQTVSAMFFRTQVAEGGLHLYALTAVVLLMMNAAGKLTMIRRIHSNFRFLSSKEEKYAVRLFDDYNTSLKMTKDCVAEKPLVAYQCRTGFLKRFLELSHEPDPSESSTQLLAPLGLISSLVLCVVCLLITRDVPTSIGAFTAACCACVAGGNMLAVNLPVSRICKTIRRAGGMIVGYEAVETFGDVNAVIADAGELFPIGTVKLIGIKPMGSHVMTEDAIMAASALVREMGGPLIGVFKQVISENEEALPEVEKCGYESGGGIVGRVDGRTVYIGNRVLLINHRLEAPSREEETQYATGNQNLIYIAIDAEVCALMVLEYAADRRRKNELQRLEDAGISVLVRTSDPNVTKGLLSRLFQVDSNSIGILDGQLGETAAQLMEAQPPRVDAVAATKGRMESMMSLVSACVNQKHVTSIVVAVQVITVILTFVLVALFACFGRMSTITTLILSGVELFWLGLVVLIPKLRR